MLRTQQQQQAMEANNLNVEILSRLSSLPTVNLALTFATDAYSKTKESNILFKYALGTAEKSVLAVAKTAEPVVNKFHAPIKVVDGIACRGLDKLEATLPVIKKSPGEMVDDTKSYYNNKVEAGINKYNEAKEYGTNQVVNATTNLFSTTYGQTIVKQINKSLDVADHCAGYMLSLPDAKDSGQDSKIHEQESIENPAVKAAMIYRKVMAHAYKNTSSQVADLGKNARDTLANLNFAMSMMEYLKKSNLAFPNEKFNQTLSDARERVNAIWAILTQEDDSHISEKKNMAEKLLYISRRLTKQLIFSFNYVVSTTQSLPESIHDRLRVSQEYVSGMHSYFTKVAGIEEMNADFAEKFRPKVEYVKNSLVEISKYPIISQALSILGKNHLKESNNNTTKNENMEDSSNDHTEDSSNDNIEDSSNDNIEDSSNDNIEDSSNDNIEDSSNDHTEDSSNDNIEDSSNDNLENSQKDNIQQME